METTNQDLNFVICIYKGKVFLEYGVVLTRSWSQLLCTSLVELAHHCKQTKEKIFIFFNKWNREVFVHTVHACYKYSSNKVRCIVMVHTVYNWRQYLQTPFCELGRLDLWIPIQKSSQLVTAKNNKSTKIYNIKLFINN